MPQAEVLETLPSTTQAAMAAVSTIAQRLPASFAAREVTLTASMPGPDWGGVPDNWLKLACTLDSHAVKVALHPGLLPRAVAGRWPEVGAVGLPAALRSVLLGVLLADVSDLVERWCGARPEWEGVCVGESFRHDASAFPHAVLIRRGAEECTAAFWLDDAGLAWAAGHCAALPRLLIDLDSLPVTTTLSVGRMPMTARELQAIGVGDVVLLDEAPVAEGGALAVVLRVPGGAGLRGRVRDGRLQLDATLDGVLDMPDVTSPSLDDMPLTVECEVGRLTLPLSRLRELAPGQVLDLGFDATTRVTLRVNGQAIAVGELVRIAQRTGVRLYDVHLPRS